MPIATLQFNLTKDDWVQVSPAATRIAQQAIQVRGFARVVFGDANKPTANAAAFEISGLMTGLPPGAIIWAKGTGTITYIHSTA